MVALEDSEDLCALASTKVKPLPHADLIQWVISEDGGIIYSLTYVKDDGEQVFFYFNEIGRRSYDSTRPEFLNDLTPEIAEYYGDEDFPATLYEDVACPSFDLDAGMYDMTLTLVYGSHTQQKDFIVIIY